MNKYHKKFLDSFACENIVGLFSRYKGSAKEVTESWGMLEAAKRFCDNIDQRKIIIVGDGCSPRTGVIFAYYTKADVVSVDPNFNMDHWAEHFIKQTKMGFAPQRIKLIKDHIQNVVIDCDSKDVIVVWPHSHADMRLLRIENYKDVIDIAMPCCVPIAAQMMRIPHIVYDDINICSPKRTVHIWSDDQRVKLNLTR